MNPWIGALCGVVGNIVYQLIMIDDFRKAKGFYPWEDTEANMTVDAWLFGQFVKIVAAACVSGVFVHLGQISGIWAAGLIGMGADQIVKTNGIKIIKEAKNETN